MKVRLLKQIGLIVIAGLISILNADSSDTEVKHDATGFIYAVPCAANDKPHSFMDNFMDMLLTPEKIIEFSEYSDINMNNLTADDIRKLESPDDDAACNFLQQWSDTYASRTGTETYRFYEFGDYYFHLGAPSHSSSITYVIFNSDFEFVLIGMI
jgi:hypothetical protein